MTFPILLLAAALSAGNAEFDRTAAEGAARITVERFAADLAAKGPESGSLSKAMLADPAAHRLRGDSEKACRALYEESVARAFAEEAGRVRARLGLDESFALTMDEGARQALGEKFPSAFDAERRAAVEEQARGLATALRPGEEEFEAKSEDDLRREMTDRIVAEQKTSVFDENRAYITTALVEPMLQGGREERRRQGEYLRRARSEAAAPSALSEELKGRLQANVDERRRTSAPTNAWGVFPSVVRDVLPSVVEKKIVDRFIGRIETVPLDVSGEDVMKLITADPAAHYKASASEKAFSELYSARILADALAKSLADAPDGDRAELRDYLAQRMASEGPRKAVDRLVRREVMPKWKAVRAEVAKRCSETAWPMLAEGVWYPDAETADAVSARSDYAKVVRDWRKLPALEPLARAGAEGDVLEEVVSYADAKVAACFDLARTAIAAESAIVDEVHPAILADSRARKESFFRRTPDLAAVTERLTAATVERWNQTRHATLWPDGVEPSNADEQHAGLFPSVKRKIELVARQILEEMNTPEEPKPEEPEPEEPKPEEPTPEDAESDTPQEQLQLFSLSIQRTGGEIEIKLMQGKSVVAEERVESKAAAFKSAMDRLVHRLSSDFLGLR